MVTTVKRQFAVLVMIGIVMGMAGGVNLKKFPYPKGLLLASEMVNEVLYDPSHFPNCMDDPIGRRSGRQYQECQR